MKAFAEPAFETEITELPSDFLTKSACNLKKSRIKSCTGVTQVLCKTEFIYLLFLVFDIFLERKNLLRHYRARIQFCNLPRERHMQTDGKDEQWTKPFKTKSFMNVD